MPTSYKYSPSFSFSDHHLGRAVIMLGVPYVYTQSRILKVLFGEWALW